MIAREPALYRIFMVPAMLEKSVCAIVCIVLFAQPRIVRNGMLFGLIDLALGAGLVFAVLMHVRQPCGSRPPGLEDHEAP